MGAGERDRVKEGREELVEESQRLNRVVGLSRNSSYVNDPSSNLYIVLPANFNEEAVKTTWSRLMIDEFI